MWQLQKGYDIDSKIADPLFLDREHPENENFDLDPASPAYKLGFKPIDLEKVGPKENLK